METFLNEANPFWRWLLRTSAQAALLVCIVLLVQWLCGKRLLPRWRFALWWLVLARLMMPVSTESALSIFNLVTFSATSRPPPMAVALAPRQDSPPNTPAPGGQEPSQLHIHPVNPPPLLDPATPRLDRAALPSGRMALAAIPARPSLRDRLARLLDLLPAIWLGGVVLLGARVLLEQLRLSRAMRLARAVNDTAILTLLEECKCAVGVATPLTLIETSRVKSPALYGLFRPWLLLPEGLLQTFSRDELRHIFLHELGHVKRRDIAVNWLAAVLQVLHWFNPLVWLAFGRMRADRELACDALALTCAAPDESKAYGQTIIKLLEGFTRPARLPGLVGILEDQDQMKRRIAMIARFKRTPRWSAWALLGLILLGLVTLTDAQSRKPEGAAASQAPPPSAAKPQNVDTKAPISVPTVPPRDAMAQKLDSILIEEFVADNLPLGEVISHLQITARARDPEKQGINFILAAPTADSARPSSVDPATGLPVRVEPPDLRRVTVSVLPALRNVTLREALEVVVRTAGVPIQYSVESYGVAFSLKRVEDTPPLRTRQFKVDPNTFLTSLRAMVGTNLGAVEPLVNPGSTNAFLRDLSRLFSRMGVDLEPPKSLLYNDRLGVLWVRAPLRDLDVIEQALQVLNTAPAQLTVEVKWCEIEEDASRSLGFDWLLGSAPTNGVMAGLAPSQPAGAFPPGITASGLRAGTNGVKAETARLTGILTDPQFRVVLRALEQRQGANMLSSPKVTTLSGRQAQIKTVEVRSIVTDLDWSSNGAALDANGKPAPRGMPISEPFELGPVLDVVPSVGADGYSIALTVIASIKEFVGYDLSVQREMTEEEARKRFGAGGPQAKVAAIPSDPHPLPIFRVRQVVSSAVVWDGQTLVLEGGAATYEAPGKNKLPAGFAARPAAASPRKRLLIFVTPTLIDPAGNRVHSPEEMLSKNAVPPQKAVKVQ